MIKLLRQGAIERPWLIRVVMFVIAAAFVISMGWWGFGPSNKLYVAQIDEIQISRQEYRQAYQSAYRFYRNIMADDFDEETLKKIVIRGLIEHRLWLKAADQLGLSVGFQEVANVLMKDRSFHRKGRFDPEQYRWALANSRPPMTPEQYENGLREDLLVEKVKGVVRDGIALTEQETKEAKAMVANPELLPEKQAEAQERVVQNVLQMKKQRAFLSYLESVRANTMVEIQEWLL